MLKVTHLTTDKEIQKEVSAKIKACRKKLAARAILYAELLELQRSVAKFVSLGKLNFDLLQSEITKLERKVKELKGN